MTINFVATVCIFVSDQDRAKEFYTQKLGMDVRADSPLYPGASARWLAVAPAGARTELILYLMDENWQHYRNVMGKSQAITLDVSDMAGLVAELKERGVAFAQEPDVHPWGTFATLIDSEGNQLLLVEQPHG
jgi:lactoylglutathione lyase